MKKLFILLTLYISFFNYLFAKGTIVIKSNITDAYIYVDGKRKAMIGNEDVELYLNEGEYLVEVKKTTSDAEYKGSKKIFVGDDTKVKIDIKATRVEKEKVSKISEYKKQQKLVDTLKNYYDYLNKNEYEKAYNILTTNYKKEVPYSRYLEYWGEEVKAVGIISSEITNKVDNKYSFDLKIIHIKSDNSVYCEEANFIYVYQDNNWLIDKKINPKRCNKTTTYKIPHKYSEDIIIEVPTYVLKNEEIKVNINVKNKNNYKKGGVTVTLFDKKNVDIYDINSSFTTAKHYKSGSKLWNKKLKEATASKYDVIEGWSNTWGNEKTKTLSFKLKATSKNNTVLMIRNMFIDSQNKEYPTPKYTRLLDQQGYGVNAIVIPTIDVDKTLKELEKSETLETSNSKKSKLSKNQKLELLYKKLDNYYEGIHSRPYAQSYDFLSTNYKNIISYDKFINMMDKKIKKVKMLDKKLVYKNDDLTKVVFKHNIVYKSYYNKINCEESTYEYIYKDKWYMNKKTYIGKCKGTKLHFISGYPSRLYVTAPLYYTDGDNIMINTIMKKDNSDLNKGGVTISLQQRRNLRIHNVYSTFESNNTYKSGDKMWNKDLKKAIKIRESTFEGWDDDWGNNTKKELTISVRPKKRGDLNINIRALLINKKGKEYLAPTIGTDDQQGYPSRTITIPFI